MRTFLSVLIIVSYACVGVRSAKVLVVFPMPIASHNILGSELAKGLAKGGLDVTYVSPFSLKNPPSNLKEITLDGLAEWHIRRRKTLELDLFALEKKPRVFSISTLNNLGLILVEKIFSHPKIQELLTSTEHYDAVIVEQFVNDAMKIFAYHFKAPLIMFTTMGTNKWVNGLVGNPEPPSYVPDFLSSFDVNNISFMDRVENLLAGLIYQANLEFFVYPAQNKLLKQFYPNAPHINSLLYNVSLIFVNSHESINPAVPRVPNLIDIGGFHVTPPKPLPNNLKAFMDNAKDGVIFFSMGTNLMPSKMPKSIKDAILTVLGSRKERVMWKWDEDDMADKPENFMLSKWFPQTDILAHPNCKLFITHGGILSTMEAVYHGVPVLTIPIFGDQKANAQKISLLGYGKDLEFSQVNEPNLREVLHELLENPKYQENAKYRSNIMRDRPVAPMDAAVYWVNYVIRHKGARHLRVAGVDLPFYEYLMLDVFAALLAIVFISFYLVKKAFRMCFNRNPKRKIKQT